MIIDKRRSINELEFLEAKYSFEINNFDRENPIKSKAKPNKADVKFLFFEIGVLAIALAAQYLLITGAKLL